jgi:hypothetical protein
MIDKTPAYKYPQRTKQAMTSVISATHVIADKGSFCFVTAVDSLGLGAGKGLSTRFQKSRGFGNLWRIKKRRKKKRKQKTPQRK